MLRQGAKIAIVAPGSAPNPPRLAAAMEELRNWGYTPVASPNIAAQSRYTAGTSAERIADLRAALCAPDIDAVWFARGGYGTAHTLGCLDAATLETLQSATARPVIGFSDATALLGALANQGIRAIHGPVLETLVSYTGNRSALPGVDNASGKALRALLAKGQTTNLPGRQIAGPALSLAPSVQGRVLGGNLTVLTSLIGTPWALQMDDAILVLEDTGERPYRIDRLATQLMQSGSLHAVRAIALGTFDRCGDDNVAADILAEIFAPLGVPIIAGLPVGHGTTNIAWVHGANGKMSTEGIEFA